jgi:hypothetical protein
MRGGTATSFGGVASFAVVKRVGLTIVLSGTVVVVVID